MEAPSYLPLGSIVRLKQGTKFMMIYGRCQTMPDGEEYDYLGCLYPEGYIRPETSFVFNHDAIEEVLHRGFVDEAEQQLLEKIRELRPLQTS
jgi:hypothetical protein